MEKFFNTAGPIQPDINYFIPPLARVKHDCQLRLILENDSHGAVRLDQPTAPFAQRRFGPRYIASEAIHVPVPVNA